MVNEVVVETDFTLAGQVVLHNHAIGMRVRALLYSGQTTVNESTTT